MVGVGGREETGSACTTSGLPAPLSWGPPRESLVGHPRSMAVSLWGLPLSLSMLPADWGVPERPSPLPLPIWRAGTAAIGHRCRQVVAGGWGVSASTYGVSFGGREVLELGRGDDCSTLKCTECHWIVAHINGEIHGV